MNQELTQRVIGALVITALAAIFIPMLFDDPVDTSGQVVNKLEIPEQQFPGADNPAPPLPDSTEAVTGIEPAEPETPNDDAGAETAPETSLSEQEMQATPPAEPEIDEEQEFAPADQTPPKASAPAAKTSKPQAPKTPSTVSKLQKTPAKPATSSKAAASSEPATRLAEPHKPGLKRWYLQAGSFSKKENAQSLADNLKKQGLPVFMETLQVPGKGTFYRLRVGPELDKKRAQAMQQKLEQQKIGSMLMSE